MLKSTKWTFLVGMLTICTLLLSACGGESPTATTAPAAAATNTTAPAAGAAMTDTPAAPAPAMTDTPAAAMGAATGTAAPAAGAAGAGNFNFTLGAPFDPTKYKKNAIEAGATLRVSSWGDTSEQQVNRDALARFQKIYPDVKINYEPQPDSYDTKLLAEIKGGSQPDVFYVDPGTAYQLIPAGTLQDLGPALQEVGRSASEYFPSLMGPFTGADGKVYSLPKDFGALAVFYNTDMLATTGATAPKEGWTQDDFKAFVAKSDQGSGQTKIYGTSVDPDAERWMAFALANGGKIVDKNTCAINSQIGVDTLTWWYGMYKDKSATIPSDVGAGWSGEAFAKKRIAATVQGGWLVPFLNDPKAAFGVKYDVAPLPAGKSGGTGDLLFFNGWAASAKSKFPKAAAALTLFLTSPENEDAILQTGFALPTLKGMDGDPFFAGTGVTNKESKILYAAAGYGTPDYYGAANDPKIKKSLSDATQRVYAGQQDPKAALDQACQEITPLLSGQ